MLCNLALALCLAAAPAETPGLKLTLIGDAWPPRPRVTGYEYNQKNHQDTPEFVSGRDRGAGMDIPLTGRRFRVVGVRIDNPSESDVVLDLRSPQIRGRKRQRVTVPANNWATRYFAVREPDDRIMEVEALLENSREPIAHVRAELPEGGRVTGWAMEAVAVAKELEREDRVRRELRTRPIAVTVIDDLEKTVPDARLILLLDAGLMVYEGRTDQNGLWEGRVLPGSYTVFALAEVPDRTDRSSRTVVEELPRLLALRGTLGSQQSSLRLKPGRAMLTTVADASSRPLTPLRIWVTPRPLAQAYHYQRIAEHLGSRARIESQRAIAGGRFLMLASNDLALHVTALMEPRASLSVFLSQELPARTKEATLIFAPERCARLVLDPATGAGPGLGLKARIVAVSGLRESLEVTAENLHTVYVTPGAYRVEPRYKLFTGDVASFLPYAVQAGPGTLHDLTPRGPFDLTLYFKRKDKKIQFWLAVNDALGRVLARAPGGGLLQAAGAGSQGLEQNLASLRWEAVAGMEHANLEKLSYRAELPFGHEPIVGAPKVERLRVFNVEGASGTAPGVLGPRVLALLPEVKRALDGCLRFLGLPEGMRRIHMEFDIFLPPGVGGLGGGGTITLDAQDLFPITAGADLLPGAFRHELGHNLGFGHDPYMLLAPAGVDEERFGNFGYRMLHAADFQKTLRYLEGERSDEASGWSPDGGVFAGLRLLHGPTVHKDMITERRASQQTLRLHNLSSIESLATLYSLTRKRNLAWIFRAHGWPVFDQRVDLGGSAVRSMRRHPRQLDYQKLDGTAINAWWVLGPLTGLGDAREPSWRLVGWPSAFTALDEDRPPAAESRKFLLYRKLVLPKQTEATILCAADVQAEIRLNGAAVGMLDASPQYSQPVHDELMLNQKRPFTVHLYKGENHLEVAVNQPRGSKGFLLELVTPEGKPLRLALPPDGPVGEDLFADPIPLARRNPVYNGSFEEGANVPLGWTRGPNEGALKIVPDVAIKADGERTMRFELAGSTRGGLIQRVVVTPGKKYRLSAVMRTQGLDGEAYVSLFTGDINGALAKTTPLRKANSDWRRYNADWFPGFGRVVYVACYVRGSAGTVWFDAVSLEELR